MLVVIPNEDKIPRALKRSLEDGAKGSTNFEIASSDVVIVTATDA